MQSNDELSLREHRGLRGKLHILKLYDFKPILARQCVDIFFVYKPAVAAVPMNENPASWLANVLHDRP